MFQVQGQLSCTTRDGWQSSRQIPTLCVPLAGSAHNAAVIVADAVTTMRDQQTSIKFHASVWNPGTKEYATFTIDID